MKKIIIAVNSDFIRETYSQVFSENNFEIFKTKSGKEALDLIKKEKPDIILVDTGLEDMGGFKILEETKKDSELAKIPVILYSQFEKKAEKEKAIELEAKDFIAGAEISSSEVVQRVKIVLGEQRSYRIALNKKLYSAAELINDYGFDYNFKCDECGTDLILNMIRDLSKGDDYFKVSIICPECYHKYK